VRVRILLGGASVSGPAGMADAVGSIQRLEANNFFQIAQLAFGASDVQPFPISGNGNARGIVTAILQPFQAVNDDGDDPLLTNIPHNPAHEITPCFGGETEELENQESTRLAGPKECG